MIAKTNSYRPGEALGRKTFLALLSSALTSNEIRFARQSTLQWLSVFPGDLEVRKIHAETIAKVRGPEEALPLLETLSEIDPHWLGLQKLIYEYFVIRQMLEDAQNTVLELLVINNDSHSLTTQHIRRSHQYWV